MAPEAAKLLWDAAQAAERVQRFSHGLTFVTYTGDEIRRSAVERQLEILGEALSQLRRLDPELAQQLPELARAVALRNILIHAYAQVDDAIVWGVVEAHLGPLQQRILALLPSAP